MFFAGIFCGTGFAAIAQVFGGADGFSSKFLIASACPVQPNANIFFGGSADGSASRSFIASVCPPQPNSNIFFGGNADGSVFRSFVASVCPPQPNSNIYILVAMPMVQIPSPLSLLFARRSRIQISCYYFGGNADGSDSKSLITSVCPPQPNSNIFFGGNADGFVSRSFIATVCPPKTKSNIYYGGNADGSKFGKLITAPCIILPIELIAFTGACEKQRIILNWSTANEKDNHYFTIESSDDGTNWKTQGRVDGAGNSKTIHNYAFYDTMPVTKSLIYYRLKQTDYDDNYKYWYIITVDKCGNKIRHTLSPPFQTLPREKFLICYSPGGKKS